MSLQFTVTLDEAEVNAIIQRATDEVRALAAKSLTAQLIAPMVKERIVPQTIEQSVEPQAQTTRAWAWDDSITLGEINSRVRSLSVPTATLLAQKASIIGCTKNSHLHLKMAKPFAEQFSRQQPRANVLIQCARELLGDKTKVSILTEDGTWYDLEYKDVRVSTAPAQAVAVPQEAVPNIECNILLHVFRVLNRGTWGFKPEQPASGTDGERVLKSVKYCRVETIDGEKVVALFWLPRTPGLCYLNHGLPGVRQMLGDQPYAVLKKWNEMGLIKGETSTTTTRSMSIRGKARRLVPLKIEALKALGVDTSWACEP
jgi:hypothetical protein